MLKLLDSRPELAVDRRCGSRWIAASPGSLSRGDGRGSGTDLVHDYHQAMGARLVFAEPIDPSAEPFRWWSDWCRRSGSNEAREARSTINALYLGFPDPEGVALSRLHGKDAHNFLQALDELRVHDLLPKSSDVRHEEERKTGPDFRIYDAAQRLTSSIEVRSVFQSKSFESEIARNGRFVDDINARIGGTSWYVAINDIKWIRQPRVTHVVKWLGRCLSELDPPSPGLARDDYPQCQYEAPELELSVTFIPRLRDDGTVGSVGKAVLIGPPVFEWSGSSRLRVALRAKAGGRYNHVGRPFAIFLCIHDNSDSEDLVNAIYGDNVVRFPGGSPDRAFRDRSRNGFFGSTRSHPNGRNTRVSCVFAQAPAWTPGSVDRSKVLRFDNPFAEHLFPEDLVATDHRLAVLRTDTGVAMEWEPRK